MAQDEWRVEVHLHDVEHGFPLSERLRAIDLDDEVAARLGDRVIVSRDGPRLYVYTQSGEAAREAERVVTEVVAGDRLTAEIRRRRWNPVDRFWQDADAPLPEQAAEGTAEAEAEVDADGGGDDDEEVQHPFFVFVEGHEPRFMRDLGL